MKKSFISSFLTLFLVLTMNLQAKIVTRAAMDVGSAETKLMVADIDTETNQIVNYWYDTSKKVELRHDLAINKDGCLSAEITEKFIKTIKEMQRDCKPYSPQEWTAVGTAVFRKAKNGQEFLDKVKAQTGIEIRLVSQQEEGEIGFRSAVAASGLDPENVISWDSGSGSFQIATLKDEQIAVYGAEFGYISVLESLFANRGKALSTDSPNPITLEEIYSLMGTIQSQLPALPDWLKTHQKKMIAIGGTTSVFNCASISQTSFSYTKEDVWKALLNMCDKSDETFQQYPEPKKAVLALVFIYTMMDHCGIENLVHAKVNGGCGGILIIPKYWKSV